MANSMERNPFNGQGGNGSLPSNLPSLPGEEDVAIEIELPEENGEFLEELMEQFIGEQPYDHWENLSLTLDEDDLIGIADQVIEEYEADKESRSEWESTFERGFDLLGLKLEESSQPFEGACTAVHPLIIESSVKFQAKASQELFPAKGPVKTQVVGASTSQTEQQAKRVQDFMNYQLTDQMPEYFDETERMLFNLPVFGSAFKKVYYDLNLERPVVEFVPIDNFYVSYNASDLKGADRYTQVIYRSPNDLRRDITSGMYALPDDEEMIEPTEVTPTVLRQKMDNILGIEPDYSQNPQYTLLEHHCYLNIEHQDEEEVDEEGSVIEKPTKNKLCIGLPYVVTVDKDSKTVLSIRRNWNENDPHKEKLLWFTHYRFVPGFGFYGLGYIHFLGNLTATSTAAMRNLIDAGQFATLPGGFKARGVRVTGGEEPIAPGEFREVEATGMDLNKAIINLPYKEPSQTLMAMLEFTARAGQKFADETDQVVSDASNYGPVGTTVALIEQSMKFFTGIHKRLHYSQRQELRILARINYDFLPNEYPYELPFIDGRIFKQDFDGRIDVLPVSDPNVPSSAHRLATSQMILQLASQSPSGTFNMKEVNRSILDSLNIANPERFLIPDAKLQPNDPITDINNASNGLPIKAFPGQDHKAHIIIKTSFIQDPTLGQNPLMAKVVPVLQANIREHMILQYEEQIGGMLKLGVEKAGTASPEAISAITTGAAQEILQNNERMAQMGTVEDLEKQTLELQKKQLQLEEVKTKIDAAEATASIALDKQKMTFEYEEASSKAAIDGEKLKLEYQELELEKMKLQVEYAETADRLNLDQKKLQVDSSEKLAKISETDKHKTLDREDHFLIEVLKVLMKETGVTSERLKKEGNITTEQIKKFEEGGLVSSPTSFMEKAAINPASPINPATIERFTDIESFEPIAVTDKNLESELREEYGKPEEIIQTAALDTGYDSLPDENIVPKEAVQDLINKKLPAIEPFADVAGAPKDIPDHTTGYTEDYGLFQINSKWLDPEYYLKKGAKGKYVDKAVPKIDAHLKKIGHSIESMMKLDMADRIELLRNPAVNEAFGRGIYDKYKLRQWADVTEEKIRKELMEKGYTNKQINSLSFDEMKEYLIKYESSGDPLALNINEPTIA
jgi:hypothetical protein